MKFSITVILVAGVLVASAFVFVQAGIFNIAADAPHSAFTYAIMETVRSRSITVRAKDVQVPALDDPTLLATGARYYAAMCGDCHLAPDKSESEIRTGLYPQPPDLAKPLHASPAEAFWVIKHGIKMSGMPAWGMTHDDSSIWSLVAFLQKLPELTPAQYQALTRTEGESHHPHSQVQYDHSDAKKKSQHTEETQKGEPPHHKQ